MGKVVASLRDVDQEIKGQVHAVNDFVTFHGEESGNNTDVDKDVDDPHPHAFVVESLLHPDVVLIVTFDQVLLNLLELLILVLLFFLGGCRGFGCSINRLILPQFRSQAHHQS